MTSKRRDLLTATELARCCRVDLKTIHNWVARGELTGFRTPGRHLRFRREDALDFLRRYGYPVPPWLTDGLPRVTVVAPHPQLEALRADPPPGYALALFGDPLLGLLALGGSVPDAAVLAAIPPPSGVPLLSMVAALQTHSATRSLRLITVGPPGSSAQHAGAVAHLPTLDPAALGRTLAALLGTTRQAE